MLKNVGKPLTKQEQKSINGGWRNISCRSHRDCYNAIPDSSPGDFSCVRRGHYGYCIPN